MSKSELGIDPCTHNDSLSDFVQIRETDDGELERLYLGDQPIRKFPGIVDGDSTCY
jgi:hypothetical protein